MGKAGELQTIGLRMYLPVSLQPKGCAYPDLYFFGAVMINARNPIMLSEKSGGQSEKDQELGQISNYTEIKNTVGMVRLGAEFEAAAFIAVIHRRHKEEPLDL